MSSAGPAAELALRVREGGRIPLPLIGRYGIAILAGVALASVGLALALPSGIGGDRDRLIVSTISVALLAALALGLGLPGARTAIVIGKARISCCAVWKTWLAGLGFTTFEPVVLVPDEVERVRFAVSIRRSETGRLFARPSLQLSDRSRTVEIPAAIRDLPRVLEALLLACPGAEVDPPTRSAIALVREGLDPEALPRILRAVFRSYLREGRLPGTSAVRLERFNSGRDHQEAFLEKFLAEQARAPGRGRTAP